MLRSTPRDTQPLGYFRIRAAVHTASGASFRGMVRCTQRHVSRNAVPGIAGRKRAFQTKFAHQR